ncbi:DUF2161 family putative PD-(D/E)XK-type phosphodiesterase [Saprospiraceae bacterium]|nr:DUF2161 family putative PD-(D/E)XK-type phosphodiesterase [Saprospiraceae bacterium]
MALRKIKIFKEEDLYDPLRKWLVNNGYEVQAEVQSCDVVAIKDDEMTIIELKKSFNLQLVYQCMERQKIGKYVYAAVAAPSKNKIKNKNLQKAEALLRRLGIGLILISLYSSSSLVEVRLQPAVVSTRKNAKKKKQVLKELEKRTGEYNVGGKQGKIVSAYRESAIHIYCLLQKEIEASPAQLIKLGAPANTGTILRMNHYGWFHKIARAKYTFDVDMSEIRKEFGDVVDFFESEL